MSDDEIKDDGILPNVPLDSEVDPELGVDPEEVEGVIPPADPDDDDDDAV